MLVAITWSTVFSDLPLRQSQSELRLFSRVEAEAERASLGATEELLAALDDPNFRAGLRSCCREVSALTAVSLLSRFEAEMETIEMMHNFAAIGPAHSDIDLAIANGSTYFYNLWELKYLKLLPPSPQHDPGCPGFQDNAETQIYGFNAFSGIDGCPGNFLEAAERPIYVAFNMLRIDIGNPHFGDVSVVFRRDYTRNMTIIAPTDTGLWEMSCNISGTHANMWAENGQSKPPPHYHHHEPRNCSAWAPGKGSLGTLDHYRHLVLANVRFWNGTGLLLREFSRVLGDGTWGSDIGVPSSLTTSYWESNFAGNVFYGPGGGSVEGGVHFIVGAFPSLFGTGDGVRLQQWCKQHRWVLLWSLGQNTADVHELVTLPFNNRMIDPSVLAHTSVGNVSGVSGNEALRGNFSAFWSEVTVHRSKASGSGGIAPADWAGLWNQLVGVMPPTAKLEPLRAHKCSDRDACIGITFGGGDCVCYNSQS